MTTTHVPGHSTESPRAVFRYTAPSARGVSWTTVFIGIAVVGAAIAALVWLF
jgi:hypothetical protein